MEIKSTALENVSPNGSQISVILMGAARVDISGHSIRIVELVSMLMRAHGSKSVNKTHMMMGAVL